MAVILLIFLLFFVAGSGPWWPHSRDWGYYPSGLLSLLFFIVLLMALFNMVPWGWWGPYHPVP
jgi:hypothetical protein